MTEIEKKFAINSLPLSYLHLHKGTLDDLMSDNPDVTEIYETDDIYIVRKDEIGVMIKFNPERTEYNRFIPKPTQDCIKYAAKQGYNAIEFFMLEELPPKDDLTTYPVSYTVTNNTNKTYKVPVYWQMSANIEVEAKDEKEAIEKAQKVAGTCELPTNADYIEDSFTVETDTDLVYEV